MKNLLAFLLIILSFSVRSGAQSVPNGDLENWHPGGSGVTSFEMPDYWQTTDSFSILQGQHSVTKETSSVYHGSSAMRLTPFMYTIFTVPGVASNGVINTNNLQIVGGTPNTVRHQKLSGWYKYTPVGGDSWSILVGLFKWNGTSRDTVAYGTFLSTSAAATYTNFEVNLNYISSADPDTVLITIYSGPSALNAPNIGTTLLIDSLTFSGVVSTVSDISSVIKSVRVFPVPALNDLTVALELNKSIRTTFEITDLQGKRIVLHEMMSDEEKIDISMLSNGNYLYNLLDAKSNKLHSGKFSVNK